MDLETYIAIGFYGVTVLHSTYNIYKSYKNHKRETLAVLQSKDLDDDIISIDPNKKSFTHNDETYMISENERCYILAGRKKICVYSRNTPEPKQLYNKIEPANDIKANEINSLINSEALRMLNKPSGMLGGMDIKQVAMVGGAIVAMFILFG